MAKQFIISKERIPSVKISETESLPLQFAAEETSRYLGRVLGTAPCVCTGML